MKLNDFLDKLTVMDSTVIILMKDNKAKRFEGLWGDFWNTIRPYGEDEVTEITVMPDSHIHIKLYK